MKDTETTANAERDMSVLLVCGDDRLSAALGQMLSQSGHVVSHGTCDDAVLEDVRRAHPEVIVIDARMCDGAGLALCQAIRQCRDLDTSKVLLLQDQGRDIDRRRAGALGANGFLAMPFGMTQFCDEVSRLTRNE